MLDRTATAEAIFRADIFAGKTVFVTGGGSGINLGIAEAFARHGASIAICGRSQERLDAATATLQGLGATVFAHTADVRAPDQLSAALDGAAEALGSIDVLVCGAAGNFLAPAEKLSPNGFKTVIDIDLLGSFNAARMGFDHLRRSRGSLIFVSAPMAMLPHAHQAHVGAAKAGVEMLMKNLALEWGLHGIRSNSIIPGLVQDTEGLKRIFGEADEDAIANHIPLRRLGVVEEIGNAALFLASPLASYITGTTLWVDGGQGLPGAAFFNRVSSDFLATQTR
jgi:NAD(P)-dependent dehydrogenase (short-subunit alcohol dehydrogenase family)